eukprot:212710_1
MAAEKKEPEVGLKLKPSLFESRKIQMDLNDKTNVNVGDTYGYLLDNGKLGECTVKELDKNNRCLVSVNIERKKTMDVWLHLPNARLCTLETLMSIKFGTTTWFVNGMKMIVEYDDVQHFNVK